MITFQTRKLSTELYIPVYSILISTPDPQTFHDHMQKITTDWKDKKSPSVWTTLCRHHHVPHVQVDLIPAAYYILSVGKHLHCIGVRFREVPLYTLSSHNHLVPQLEKQTNKKKTQTKNKKTNKEKRYDRKRVFYFWSTRS